MPLVNPQLAAPRRHVLVIGTTTYEPGWDDIGAGVDAELKLAQTLFRELLGYERETSRELRNPGFAELIREVAVWRQQLSPTENDWLVVYYTGHGVQSANGLRLITRDVPSTTPEIAPTAQALVSALLGDDPRAHVLLILDTCESGSASIDLSQVAARIREAAGGAARSAGFHTIYTATSIGRAIVGNFLNTLGDVIRSGAAAGPDDEYIDIAALVDRLDRRLPRRDSQRARYDASGEAMPRFFPNPGWLPRFRVNMERDARQRVLHRIQTQTLRTHWDPRSRGVASGDERGWFFTGRTRALRRICEWLRAEDEERGLVIRGLAGSGKSALLARIVTLADPEVRASAAAAGATDGVALEELPPIDGIAAAIHARAKDASQIALELAATLDLEVDNSSGEAESDVLEALATRSARTVVVVDALDEAVGPKTCALFLRKVMSRCLNARVLVGVREPRSAAGDLVPLLGKHFTELDLDTSDWSDPVDIQRYVEIFLRRAPGSPYQGPDQASAAKALGALVGARAGTSFLVASVTAHALRSRAAAVDPNELGPLPDDVGSALELDLARFPTIARDQIRCVLAALSCGEGRGIPMDVWTMFASAISDGDVGSAEVETWSKEASFYIIVDRSSGAVLYHLYHDEFATHLRRGVSAAQEALIADALARDLTRLRDAASPVPAGAANYVMRYYPRHLLRAGRLGALAELVTSTSWIADKRQRFGDIGPALGDLDLMIDAARRAEPPSIGSVVRGCAAYARLMDIAPPIVIDVLAGIGEPTRAQLMAENIEFPLDRCQAFAYVAQRWATLGVVDRAEACVTEAHRAWLRVPVPFDTMAAYWVVRAASHRGIEMQAIVTHVRQNTNAQLDSLDVEAAGRTRRGAASDSADVRTRQLLETRKVAFRERAFELPHWLFWAGMCFRQLADNDGLARIRSALRSAFDDSAATPIGATNLVLQTAAVSGDREYLLGIEPVGIVKPGNLALALVEAGLVNEFEKWESVGAFDAPHAYYLPDSLKRYTWALALRGNFDKALGIASSILDHPEEGARALYRIGAVAAERADATALAKTADVAAQFLGQYATRQREGASDSSLYVVPTPEWRIQSWLAAVMLEAGRLEDARALAEAVCDAAIAPSRRNSLAIATPATARSKGHVTLEDTPLDTRDLAAQLALLVESGGISAAREHLAAQKTTPRVRAEQLLQLVGAAPTAADAVELWLDAVVTSRAAGLAMLEQALKRGHDVLASTGLADELRQAEIQLAGLRFSAPSKTVGV